MATMAQIQEEINNIMSSIEDLSLDSEEARETLSIYLDFLGNQEADKIDGFVQWIKMETARIKAIREEAERLRAMAQSAERRIEFLKSKYIEIFMANGLKKVKGNIYSASLRDMQSVSVENVADLPRDLCRVKVEPDKAAIKTRLQDGEEIPGCMLVTRKTIQFR